MGFNSLEMNRDRRMHKFQTSGETKRTRLFEVSAEFYMKYFVILQGFHPYSTYKGFYFIDERSTFISSNEWRNTYEPISYRKIYSIKEKTEKFNTGTISREAWCFQ